MENEVNYALLSQQLETLSEGISYLPTVLSNGAALLYWSLPQVNWAGFYILKEDSLLLGPFQGKPACTRIPLDRGVCGKAAREKKPQMVEDVHKFPGHIACDSASRSELVIPLFAGDRLWGVLDLDSPRAGRFTETDRAGLEHICRILEKFLP